jgi:hypothetical protein
MSSHPLSHLTRPCHSRKVPLLRQIRDGLCKYQLREELAVLPHLYFPVPSQLSIETRGWSRLPICSHWSLSLFLLVLCMYVKDKWHFMWQETKVGTKEPLLRICCSQNSVRDVEGKTNQNRKATGHRQDSARLTHSSGSWRFWRRDKITRK